MAARSFSQSPKYYSPAGKAIQDGSNASHLVAEADVALESDDDSDAGKADADEPEHKASKEPYAEEALELAK